MALVAGVSMELVTGAIGSLLSKLGELLKEEYGLQKGVKEKIKSLSGELEVVHAVLREIGDVPPDQLNEPVRLWVREVREASYDMEDMVDTFLVRVNDGPDPTDPKVLWGLLTRVGTLFHKFKARREISILIQDIKKKLDEVAARRGRYTVDSIVVKPAAATTIDPRLCNLYKMATDLVGIDGPRDELINKLSQGGDDDVPDNKKMKVVSVVGIGGLGKTTLAKAVYDHLKSRFECTAFVVVGQNPDMKKVFRDILIDLKYTNPNMMALDVQRLINELKEFVKETRCFIVIDDIWDKEPWKLIICALQDSYSGSRVVVTTRIFEVGTHAGEVYEMQALSYEDSKNLLYARIFDGKEDFDSLSAEAIDKILKKCGGVPLAIITIASLLANKSREVWSEVYSSIGFGHGGNDFVDNTRKILSFSYYDLPSHLKPCLLYLSVFPEDHVIEKNSLIWKWIAEGFIEHAAGAVGSFELGERYFNELINRSMIKPEEISYESNHYGDACSVHDMVLDLIRSLSSGENFVTILDGNERQKLPGSIARRLALQHVEEHNGGLANVAVQKVRSLVATQCRFGALHPCLPVLRVLDIIGCEVDESCREGLLDHLGSLPHLRYLGITRTGITKLPGEVKYLKFLQTLDLVRSFRGELPEDVGQLTQLVCLRADIYHCWTPPGLIGKLTSLQQLLIGAPPAAAATASIWLIGKLTSSLQFAKDLGMLRELRVLRVHINCMDESMDRALLESLGNLHNIRTMHVEGSAIQMAVTSDAGSFVSHRPLQYLYLRSFVFSGLPAWINLSHAPNLSHLVVDVLVVKEQDIETLARLPELCCLDLIVSDTKSVVSIKTVNDGVRYFQKLRILRIYGPSVCFDLCGCKCDGSVVASTIMPSLESLEFDAHVRSLKDATLLGFEELLGFENLGTTSLQRVTVRVFCRDARASELEEVETVLVHKSEVHPKHPHLQINWYEYGALSPYQEACMDVSEAPKLGKKAWKLANIVVPEHIRALRISDPEASSRKVIRLLYTNKGTELLALSSNAVHERWRWRCSDKNRRGMCTTSVPPQLWQPENGILMTNDTNNGNRDEATACMALSKDDYYLVSASGGRVSVFDTYRFEVETTFIPPPPAATFLAFYPHDATYATGHIIAIGREDSSILIHRILSRQARNDEVIVELLGHQKKITGLAFSQSMGVLVSSGADAQLCVWSTDGWEKKKSRYIQPPSNNPSGALAGDTMVQFHYDETHLLVVHESHLAVYDAKQLECLRLWSPTDTLPSPISCAVYASNGLLIYAGFCDGAIGIFEAGSLDLQCRIAPSAYIPSSVSSGGGITAVAAHPWKPYQIAIATSDGGVYVLEPPLDTDVEDVEVESKASSSGQKTSV